MLQVSQTFQEDRFLGWAQARSGAPQAGQYRDRMIGFLLMEMLNVKSHRHIVARAGDSFSALGASWTPLQIHADPRGWFAEIWKTGLPGALCPKQVSVSRTNPGVTKAFHYHRKQEDLFVPISGVFRIVLLQIDCPHHAISIWWKEGAEGVLRIPAGLAHGYRVEGSTPGTMLYLTSETYSPQDEGRVEWDQGVQGFPWDEKAEVGFS